MVRKFIDISVPLRAGIKSDPPGLEPQIQYHDHSVGALEFEQMTGIPVDRQLERCGCAYETLQITTHVGTHLDAPWHYHPTQNGGEPAATIDQIPLEWCFGPGVKLDFRNKPHGYVCTAKDVQDELARIGHILVPGDIVLVNTSAGKRYGADDYVASGCGMGREATLWMIEQGMRVCGIDGWSWDAPATYVVPRIKETGNYDLWWEGHKAGAQKAYCHMEKLHNLEALPATGFTVSCFPVKIENASAGWCRAVAILEE